MNVEPPLISEAEILSQIVAPDQPGLPSEVARTILNLRFGPEALQRIEELAEKNRRGTLTPAEWALLERYRRVGNFLNLLQAKARVSLTHVGPCST
jgi:hypothetical protein